MTSTIKCVLVTASGDGTFDNNGTTCTTDDLPVGAMWDAPWKRRKGPDGRAIIVMMPGRHLWCTDARRSNCARPDDTEHRCWVRHGEPPNLTVDKNGNTCSAGAGSIVLPGRHGFLRNRELVLA